MQMRSGVLAIVAVGVLYTPTPLIGQSWDNPANRYLTAHEAYDDATCPIGADSIQHFVYFARDRRAIRRHALLESDRFVGAQIMYAWADLEPHRGIYDFSDIQEDLAYLRRHGKTLFIQLQDASFWHRNVPVPGYLRSDEFDGGATEQFYENGQPEGWVAKRWSPRVQERFSALLQALGEEFDGEVAGINLQETAIGVSAETDPSFSPELYFEGIKTNMQALATAFPNTDKLQYANFMPGEWLPWEDEGYLSGVYQHGEAIGVGLGTPDLLMQRKGQLNHPLAMMHEGTFSVPLGIAIQDGNYVGQTNSNEVQSERTSLVPKLRAFAHDFLQVDYMFWVNQEPYFEEDVRPCFE
ncbi:hypothetical protein [Cognatiyoonia sp. IB215182]|uniref:hypothetical protein n=1 Tax=Cognatiyoonia sp. IB215182 TaxID=3097353 RepID=UPI002A17F236|nr:hypothetical protein [Cognatiyoonia sp. IB215182]MDX8355760.1 hypothetical protein [Cognatiyoonia sp. IB215182]